MDQDLNVDRSTDRGPPRRNRFFVAVALALGVAGAAQAAGACSVEADGPSAYSRVKARLTDIHQKSPSVDFPAFNSIDATVDPKCVFTLKGRYNFKLKGTVHFKHFDAKLVQKSGAPMGWKILKLKTSN